MRRTRDELDPDEGLESLDVAAPPARVGKLWKSRRGQRRASGQGGVSVPSGMELQFMGMRFQREVENALNASNPPR